MPRRRRAAITRRTPLHVAADATAATIARQLGKALRDGRKRQHRTQAAAADLAGTAPSTFSEAENGHAAGYTLETWTRLAAAAGSSLHAYLEHVSAADQPRDAVHLRAQELVITTAKPGGWSARPEHAIDDPAATSRSIDVLLERRRGDLSETAVFEVWDWLDDVGAAFRSWDRRLARVDQLAAARMPADGELPVVSGCWVLRATHRNRTLVSTHLGVFTARFPGSGRAWLAALATNREMPRTPALLWISVRGDRLWPARLGTGSRSDL